MTSMNQITVTLQDLDAMLASLDEVDDLATDTILAALERVVGDAQQKAAHVARVVLHLEAMATAGRAKAKRVQELAHRRESKAKTLRAATLAMLEAAGLQKIDESDVSISVRNGGGQPRLEVLADDATLIRMGYGRIVTEVDKAAVREAAALAEGLLREPGGTELARLVPPGRVLVLR